MVLVAILRSGVPAIFFVVLVHGSIATMGLIVFMLTNRSHSKAAGRSTTDTQPHSNHWPMAMGLKRVLGEKRPKINCRKSFQVIPFSFVWRCATKPMGFIPITK